MARDGGAVPDAEDRAAATTEDKSAVRTVRVEGSTGEAARREQLENERAELDLRLRLRAFDNELDLRRRYARSLLRMMVGQLGAANAVFVAYAWAGNAWDLDSGVVQVWLGATVVQVIGVVAVVTRHLFPDRDVTPLDL